MKICILNEGTWFAFISHSEDVGCRHFCHRPEICNDWIPDITICVGFAVLLIIFLLVTLMLGHVIMCVMKIAGKKNPSAGVEDKEVGKTLHSEGQTIPINVPTLQCNTDQLALDNLQIMIDNLRIQKKGYMATIVLNAEANKVSTELLIEEFKCLSLVLQDEKQTLENKIRELTDTVQEQQKTVEELSKSIQDLNEKLETRPHSS